MKKIILFVIVIFQLMGCAVGHQIRAHKVLVEKNPIKKIALIGTGTVYWPGSGTPYIGLNSSKAGIEKVLPVFKSHLESKGYEITFFEPVAAGFPLKSHKEHPVFEDYGKEGAATKVFNLTGDDPAYVYDVSNKKIQQSGIALAFEFDDALSDGRFKTYRPDQSRVRVILTETDSDTVCYIRAFGVRYSDGVANYYARAAVINALLNLSESVSFAAIADSRSRGSLGFTCSDKAGHILWQNFQAVGGSLIQAESNLIENMLRNFPHIGVSLTKTCVVNKGNNQHYTCEK